VFNSRLFRIGDTLKGFNRIMHFRTATKYGFSITYPLNNSGSVPVAVPVVTYSNADIQKEQILIENKGKSGIYAWINSQSGKRYIGGSVSLTKRFYVYYNANLLMRDDSMVIYKALLKYGYSNFSLEILEYCEPSKCVEREQYYIDLLKPEYNISLTARAPMTGRNHSELTKIKISGGQNGEGNSFYGKIHNEETLKKIEWSS